MRKTQKKRRPQLTYRRFLLSGWTDLVVFLSVVFSPEGFFSRISLVRFLGITLFGGVDSAPTPPGF
jgi:hypothetical protein